MGMIAMKESLPPQLAAMVRASRDRGTLSHSFFAANRPRTDAALARKGSWLLAPDSWLLTPDS
jgi:hypothetical protein